MKHIVMALCMALGMTLACHAVAAPAAGEPHTPTLKVTTLAGDGFDLAAERGKWVIVNFWATWCNPCIKEMPDISAFVAGRKDVVAIGLAYEDTDRKAIAAFLAKHPVEYPIAQVDIFNPPKDFAEPRGLPTTYLIAPDGHVAKKFVGPVTSSELAQAIASGGAG